MIFQVGVYPDGKVPTTAFPLSNRYQIKSAASIGLAEVYVEEVMRAQLLR